MIVTKGVSENLKNRTSAISSVVTRPVANVLSGNTIAHHGPGGVDEAEREDYSEGQTTAGFAGSVVPTLEERTIFERRPHDTHSNGKPLFDMIDEEAASTSASTESVGPSEATVPDDQIQRGAYIPEEKKERGKGTPVIQKNNTNGPERYGAPANAVDGDEGIPNKGTDRSGKGSEEEELAIKARKTMRKHLNSKVGMSAWTMPTPTPIIDPNRFHDPLDEKFWKDMWIAGAVHNVS
jgi:phospholipase D1/2